MQPKEKIAPSERIREEIAEIMDGRLGGQGLETETYGALMQRAKKLLAQELLEGEVGEFLQRGRYQRRQSGGRTGYRNGYEASCLRTPEGKVSIEMPQVRDTEDPFPEKWGHMTNFLRKATSSSAVQMHGAWAGGMT